LAEWKATEEVELEEEFEEHDGDDLEEVMVEADEGSVLTLDTHHPPKGKENLSIFFITFGEPSTFFPTPPTPKALKQTFCQFTSKPLLTAPNPELRACEKVVPSMFKESPSSTIPISKGKVKKRVSKFKRDLFDWLILFQPNLIQKGEVIT